MTTSHSRPTTTPLSRKQKQKITHELSKWTDNILDKVGSQRLAQDPEFPRLVFEHILPTPDLQEAVRSLHHHMQPYIVRQPVDIFVTTGFHYLRLEASNAFPMLAGGLGNIYIKVEQLPPDSPLAQYLAPLVARYLMCYDRCKMVKDAVWTLLEQAKTLEQVAKSVPALVSLLPGSITPGPRTRRLEIAEDLNAAILYLRMLEAST